MFEFLQEKLFSIKNKERALKQQAYLKDLFPFLGIPKPNLNAILKESFRTFSITTEQQLHQNILLLWKQEEREFHYAAIECAKKHKKLWTKSSFTLFEEMIRTRSWWDSVDDIASNMIGTLLMKYPDLIAKMDQWINEDYLWIRRAAILYQLKWKKKTDQHRLFTYCEKKAHEKEFFIKKAIGWALREYSKTNPKAVLDFVKQTHLSTLSLREAMVYLLK